MTGVVQCTVRPIDEQGGRLEVIRRRRLVESFPTEVMQTCLFAVSDRESLCDVDGVRYHFRPGSVMYFRAGQSVSFVNTIIPPDGTTYRGIELAEPSFVAVLGESTLRTRGYPGLRSPIVHDPELAGRLLRHHEELLATSSDAELQAELRRLLESISSHPEAASFDRFQARALRPDVLRAVRYIQRNFAGSVSVDDLAREARLSASRLAHVFLDTVGVSPYYYLIQYRVQRAKMMLCGRMPLAEVAACTGFADQAHFTRHFKRMTALTPGQYVGRTTRRAE